MLRLANQDDLPFLLKMLKLASNFNGSPVTAAADAEDPRVAAYLDGWVRPGDCGLIAMDDSGTPIGGAWYRLFPSDSPGYGFIDDQTPELAIAVVADSQGKGFGSKLLAGLRNMARVQGYAKLSLCVDPGNLRARLLYAKLGFREVHSNEELLVMTLDLPAKR